MHDLHEHVTEVSKGINWPFVLAAMGMIAGSVSWSVRKVFTTHKDMENCKAAVLYQMDKHEVLENKKLDELAARHEHQNSLLWKDIKWIKAFLIEHGPTVKHD